MTPKNILITGASSGLGEEFARQYASPETRLYLAGRNTLRLENVAAFCRSKGAEVIAKTIDVTDRSGMSEWILSINQINGLDLVIANAGISGGFSGQALEDIVNDYKIFDINLTGVLNTIYPALPDMARRRTGQIVIISSLAGFVPMPSAPAYAASKAAVRFYGEALRSKVAAFDIKVTVICPGFIKSRMTDVNTFPMPFLLNTTPAVTYMISKIDNGAPRIDFPWMTAIPLKILGLLPNRLRSVILGHLPEKN